MAKRKAAAKAAGPSFEDAIARLEEIVHELEEADLPLERSLAVFEEGVRLARLLNGKLNEAERKVEILLRDERGETTAVPFRAAGAGAQEEDGDDADDGDDGDDDGSEEDGEGPGGGQAGLF